MKINKKIISIGLAVLVSGTLLVGCSDGEDDTLKEDADIETTSESNHTEEESHYINEMNDYMVAIDPLVNDVRELIEFTGEKDEFWSNNLLTNVQKFDAIIPYIRAEPVPSTYSEMDKGLMVALDELEVFTTNFLQVSNGQGNDNSMSEAFRSFEIADNLISTYKEKLSEIQ